MTLIVHAAGAYRVGTGQWRDKDFLIRNLVKALKGEAFKGYSDFSVGKKAYRITSQDPVAAYIAWANWAGLCLRDKLNLGKVALVPVPSSSQTKFGQDTCPVRMAESIVKLVPKLAVAGHYLRHKTAQPRAHADGGTRDAAKIEKTLACLIPPGSPRVVLVDDVLTTGGHVSACARVLRSHGATVEHVLVAGRAVWTEIPDPLSVDPEDLEANPFDF